MKRTLLLMLPVIALATGNTEQTERKTKEEMLGSLWQASLSAEKNGESAEAMAKTLAYSKNGGDGYLATMRAGWLAYGQKKYDEANRHYSSAMRQQGIALSPRLGLLTIAQEQGDVAAAARAGDLVLQLEPTNYRALLAVAWGAFQAKDYQKALGRYRCVMALYPEDTDALSGAAWAEFYKGQKAEARQLFRRLLSINPDYQYAKQGLEATK
ncbi:MAG: tetratricopeptide repeat protein [Verrucomicrobiota bacterium]